MTLLVGDCLDVMPTLDADSIDAIVTDPPYGLGFMGKAWDKPGSFVERKARRAADGFDGVGGNHHPTSQADVARTRLSEGVKSQAWHEAWAVEALRVAKPGAYLLAFGGTRTVHRMTCAIEDAGWIVRDMLVWAYASGFPKSKANLKPAWEPIVMARKPGPLRPLDIDGCRIGVDGGGGNGLGTHFGQETEPGHRHRRETCTSDALKPWWCAAHDNPWPAGTVSCASPLGRWPANVLLTDPVFDGGWEGVVGGGDSMGIGRHTRSIDTSSRSVLGGGTSFSGGRDGDPEYLDSGTYSRFFLVPKAARSDREPVLGGLSLREAGGHVGQQPGKRMGRSADEGANVRDLPQRANVHPTVKPTDLMRHLVRLVTPQGGTVLDPFLGSGTTALACEAEGFAWVGIEREPEYAAIANARLNGTQRGLGLTS